MGSRLPMNVLLLLQRSKYLLPLLPLLPPPPKKKSNSVIRSQEVVEPGGCPYVFSKGKKRDQRCGCRPKGGKKYCSRHKKYEGDTPKVRKMLPPTRRSIVTPKKKTGPKKKPQEIVLYKGPQGKLHHRPTGFVFGDDKVVIGTWLKAIENPSGVRRDSSSH